ncbi:MAG TPA: GNAT family N-acetyltransferase [Actinomycetes bacterium]|nr:GNAT family N-acetyltransferase [Actinomycetes bacterium]
MEFVTLATSELSDAWTVQVRALLWASFDDFTEDDWQHGLGGIHVVALIGDGVVGHASVVPRTVYCDGDPFDTGYVEGVAVSAAHRRRGIGTAVMTLIGSVIRDRYAFGVLGTGEYAFYESLTWRRWQGQTFVRDNGRLRRTPDDDDGIMVLPGGDAWLPPLRGSLAVDARPGDDW